MGHNYSDDEITELEADLDKINEKWNEYVAARLDGADGDTHNPPALNRATSELLDHLLYTMAEQGNTSIVGTDLFVGFAANMFAFGQWAVGHGLRMSDMFGCKCSNISDDDLNKLLNR